VAPPDASGTEPSAKEGETLELELRLVLSGSLVRGTVKDLVKGIRVALQASPREVVVDLTGVERIDEAGLTALLKAHLRSRQHGLPIRFVPADHQAVRQLAAVTGNGENSD
jgi:anti-anti-sigma regulatory factor